MDRLRKRKKPNTIIESDDENNSDVERDRDWVPKDDETDRNQSNEGGNDTSLPEDTEFDSTEGFRLKTVKTMKQSNHLIWTMFGRLMKNDKNVDKVKDRVYCIKCFEKKKFKRYYNFFNLK